MNALKEYQEERIRLPNELFSWGSIKFQPGWVAAPYHITDSETVFKKILKGIEYDEGYGTQELFGVVVFESGNWLERYEYDGSEQWVFKSKPLKSEFLIK